MRTQKQGRTLFLLTLALLWVCLPLPARAAAEALPSVHYGGEFQATRAERLALSAAWLSALEQASAQLAGVNAVRLAGFDDLQRQALAALLGMPLIELKRTGPGFSLDYSEASIQPHISLKSPDNNEILRWLGQTGQLQRRMEVIVALRRIVPQALQLAEEAHAFRLSHGPEDRPDDKPGDELDSLADQLEGYALYLDLLKHYDETWQNPEDCLLRLGAALDLAPDALPLLVSQGELFLLLDRPGAALRSLAALAYPEEDDTKPSPASYRQVELDLYVRGLHLRALAQLSSGHSALAESDWNRALALAPQRADLWLARGALHQVAHNFEAMCPDYHQACNLGLCDGLAAARRQGYCLGGNAGAKD